jgi:hypothetical protein
MFVTFVTQAGQLVVSISHVIVRRRGRTAMRLVASEISKPNLIELKLEASAKFSISSGQSFSLPGLRLLKRQ